MGCLVNFVNFPFVLINGSIKFAKLSRRRKTVFQNCIFFILFTYILVFVSELPLIALDLNIIVLSFCFASAIHRRLCDCVMSF